MEVYLSKDYNSKVRLSSHQVLGSGAEGIVYYLKNSDDVIKIYHPQERNKQRAFKLNYLIENKPKLEYQDSIIFPKEVVYDKKGDFVGFSMDKVENTIDLTLLCNLRPSEKLNLQWLTKFSRNTKQGLLYRLRLCHNIAVALHKVYETRKYVIVDIKPENIRVQLNGKIFVIDMDSVEVIKDNQLLFYAEKLTPEYSPAEIKSVDAKKDVIPLSWDYFSMAVVFYKIMLGLHPFVGTCHEPYEEFTSIPQKISRGLFPMGSNQNYFKVIPEPHQNFYALPQNIQNLFIECFDGGFREPQKRPNTKKWIEEIRKVQTSDFKDIKVVTKRTQKPKPRVRKKQIQRRRYTNTKKDYNGIYFLLTMLSILLFFVILSMLFPDIFKSKYSQTPSEKSENMVLVSNTMYQKYIKDKQLLYDYTDDKGNILVVDGNDKYGIVNTKQEQVLIPCQYDSLTLFEDGLARIKINGLFGYINKYDNIDIPVKYEKAFSFYQDKAVVKLNGKYISISKSGKVIKELSQEQNYGEFEELKPGYLLFYQGTQYGFIDYHGDLVLPAQYKYIKSFVKKHIPFVAVSNQEDKWGLIDLEGNIIVPLIYNQIEDLTFTAKNLGLLAVKNDSGWGILDLDGKLLINCEYNSKRELVREEYSFLMRYKISQHQDKPNYEN